MLLIDYKFMQGSERDLFTADSHPISSLSAILILFCMMTGDDANYFDSIYQNGIVNVLTIALFSMLINILSTHIFVRTWRFNFGLQYADVVQDIFNGGKTITRIIFIIALVYTGLVIQQCAEYNIRSIVAPHLKNSYLTNSNIMNYVIIPLFILPFMLVKRFASLRYYLMLGNIGVLVVLVVSIYFFVKCYKENGFDPQKQFVMISKSFWGCYDIFSGFSSLFWGQPFLCAIASTLPKTSQKSVIATSVNATIIVFIVNLAISLFIHFTFWGTVGNDDALAYYDTSNIASIIGLIGSFFNNVITTCGYLYVASNELIQLFFSQASTFTRFFSSIIIYLFCCLLATYYVAPYSKYFDIIGKTCYLIIAYYIPPIVYLKAFRVKSGWGILSIIYLLFIICYTGARYYDLLER